MLVRLAPEYAAGWPDADVERRWAKLFRLIPQIANRWKCPTSSGMSARRHRYSPEKVAEYVFHFTAPTGRRLLILPVLVLKASRDILILLARPNRTQEMRMLRSRYGTRRSLHLMSFRRYRDILGRVRHRD